MAVTGDESYFNFDDDLVTRIYKNKNLLINPNTKPCPPINLVAISSDEDPDELELSWDKASDNETAQDGLSYNIYVGKSTGSNEVVAPMSDIATGFRKIAVSGNVNSANSYTAKGLEPGTYYWSVQSVDNCFTGSEFAEEQAFIVTSIDTDNNLPTVTALTQNYPNPFNPLTEISYSISEFSDVKLSVFNVKGEFVETLVNSKIERGNHTIKFNAVNLNSGVYFYKLLVDGSIVDTKKMLLIK